MKQQPARILTPSRTIHRLSDRGIIWRVEDSGVGPLLRVRCRAESVEEAALWRNLASDPREGVWALTDVEEKDGEFTLTTRLYGGVSLTSWLSTERGAEAEAMLRRVKQMVQSLPAGTLPETAELGDRILVVDNMPLFASVPWLQLDGGSVPDCSKLQRERLQAAARRLRQALTESDVQTSHPGAGDEPTELPETGQIPRMRLSAPRAIPIAIVSLMALSLVLGFVWWRYQAAWAKTDCPTREQVLPAVTAIMQSRARAIMSLDEEALSQIERDPLLSEDVALISRLRGRDWSASGLDFPVASLEVVSCRGDVVEVLGSIGQSAFKECQADSCKMVSARDAEQMMVYMNLDLSQIVAVQRAAN